MAKKYKIKITKAYHIAIEDENGYEVASDWSFLDYTETKKQAEKLLAEVDRREIDNHPTVEEQDPKEIEKELEKCKGKIYLLSKGDCYKDYEEYIYENGEWCLIGEVR